ncbi:MAG TPA: hypothetical protein VIP70_12830 [Nitrososphaeraceae archaeon]|jgi:hypothetical protein
MIINQLIIIPPWLSPTISAAISRERNEAEKILKLKYERDKVITILWTAAGKQIIAAIRDDERVRWGSFTAHGSLHNSPSGILGVFGRKLKIDICDILFIVPLWIWKR